MSTEKPTQTAAQEQVSSTDGTIDNTAVENISESTAAATAGVSAPKAEDKVPAGIVVTGDVSDDPAAADAAGDEAAGEGSGDDPQGEVSGEGFQAETVPTADPAEKALPEESGTEEVDAVEEIAEAAKEDPVAVEAAEAPGEGVASQAGASEDAAGGEEEEGTEAVDATEDNIITAAGDTAESGPDSVSEAVTEAAEEDPVAVEAAEAPVEGVASQAGASEDAAGGEEEETEAVDAAEDEISTAARDTAESGPDNGSEGTVEVVDLSTDKATGSDTGSQKPDDEPQTEANTGQAPVAAGGEAVPSSAGEETGEESRKVDFSDEEAELDRLAADKPEFRLGEEEESELAHESISGVDDFDVAAKSKSQLLDTFAVLLAERPVQTIRRQVDAIKVAFYRLLRAEQEELRHRFISEGGQPEDFAPPVDNEEERLKDLFGEYRRRRDEFIAQLDRSKEENLKIKLKVIEDLKELVGGSETLGNTFSAFRELQQRWRDAGPVPQANVKDLWETYNHHVENFYSYIKINKELRDLDLKKNYEAKVALCEEAESLVLEPSVVNSFHRLQKLHEQWRETGPVANEYKESLWERFREASSRINKQHQEYFDRQKDEQKRNLELKTELCIKTEELAEGVWTTRKEWNKASDRLLEIQKVWKTIGFAPKKDNGRIYERFRNACDKFFEQKRLFYQQVKIEMEHNLQLKNELCEAAEAIQDSEEWKKTTDELIALQKKWKEVGPVARRHSDAVWKRFRAACDHFFSRKSQHFASKDSEQEGNLKMKRELLAEIAAADVEAGGFDMIKEFQRRWSEIGFVPIKQKDAVQKEYKEAMDQAFSVLRGSGQAVRMDRFRDKVRNMKSSGDKRLRFERERLYNKVKQMESEIALLENNIGFFANSKNAESMIRDVKEKIERTREEMAAAIEKINLIDREEA